MTQLLWCSWIPKTFPETPLQSQDGDGRLEEASRAIESSPTAESPRSDSAFPTPAEFSHYSYSVVTQPCCSGGQTAKKDSGISVKELTVPTRYRLHLHALLGLDVPESKPCSATSVPKYEGWHTRKGSARYMVSFVHPHFSTRTSILSIFLQLWIVPPFMSLV